MFIFLTAVFLCIFFSRLILCQIFCSNIGWQLWRWPIHCKTLFWIFIIILFFPFILTNVVWKVFKSIDNLTTLFWNDLIDIILLENMTCDSSSKSVLKRVFIASISYLFKIVILIFVLLYFVLLIDQSLIRQFSF